MSDGEIRRVGLDEAQQLLADGYRYVDVRTVAEFDAGHPAGARNVPFMVSAVGGLQPNEQFLQLMQALFSSSDKLVLGCQQGQRSAVAVALLSQAGFVDVVDMRPGYGGLRNAFGQVREPGWAAAGLPTELATEGGSYAELMAQAGLR